MRVQCLMILLTWLRLEVGDFGSSEVRLKTKLLIKPTAKRTGTGLKISKHCVEDGLRVFSALFDDLTTMAKIFASNYGICRKEKIFWNVYDLAFSFRRKWEAVKEVLSKSALKNFSNVLARAAKRVLAEVWFKEVRDVWWLANGGHRKEEREKWALTHRLMDVD